MRRLLVALLLCLLTGATAEALDLHAHARTAGLPDSVPVHLVTAPEMNGYYTSGGVMCMWIFCQQIPEHIAIFAPAGTPDEKILAVLFHEILHYHWNGRGQWKKTTSDMQFEEWSADAFAIQHLCRLGYNGPEVMARILSWTPWGYDAAHGYSIQRVHHTLGQSCSARGLEA